MSSSEEEKAIATDGMIGAIPVNPKLSEVLEINSEADDFRKLREEAEEQFNLDKLKEKYRKKLLTSKEFRGDKTLTETDIDLAVQNHLDRFYEFKPIDDVNSFSTKVARVYVRRRKIARKYGVPILAAAALAGVIYAGSIVANAVGLKMAEKKVETAIETSYGEKQQLISKITSLESDKNLLPEANDLVSIIVSSQRDIGSTEDFFNKYCDEGTASDDITPENYAEAKQNLSAIEGILGAVKEKVGKGEGLVGFEKELISTRQSLDSLVQEIKSSSPPNLLMTRANIIYNSGIASLANRQLDQAKEYQKQLREVKGNVKEFETLPDKLEQIYSSIKQVAVEKSTVQQADKLHSIGLNYVNTVDVNSLKQTISQLDELNIILNQSYTVRIVSRQGVKSGVERGYEGLPSNYYAVVEAVDSDGNVLEKSITNSEDGKNYDVTLWAERISQEAYEGIKKDKMDDGIIQDNIFAKKEIGYLNEELIINRILAKREQITSW